MRRGEFGLKKDSVILLEQIRTIDKKRLMSRIGELPKATMSRVNRAILISLGFAEQDATAPAPDTNG